MAMLFSILASLLLAACAAPSDGSPISYPLTRCEVPPANGAMPGHACVATLFAPGADIEKRRRSDFPARYLELYKPEVRKAYCDNLVGASEPRFAESTDACLARLDALSRYFNPSDGAPGVADIGLALEGGGTKAGSFAMGALAGLQQVGLLAKRVTAISSVSGGTYAASYYFNRLFDKLESYDAEKGVFLDKSGGKTWFCFCIPDYYLAVGKLGELDRIARLRCHDGSRADAPHPGDEDDGRRVVQDNQFIRHVWENRDLINGATEGDVSPNSFTLKDIGHLAYVVTGSVLSMPVDVTSRSLFRWPGYSSPSDFSYGMGLERDYGYSPQSWAEAPNSYLAHVGAMLTDRRQQRTFGAFRDKLAQAGEPLERESAIRVPLWIANSAAPGDINAFSWFTHQPRDPIRQTFELTWNGYGSGTYGYANVPPPSSPKWFQPNPPTMPIVEAVIGSAAFADSDEILVDDPLTRLGIGLGINLLNTPWFVEIANFNVDDRSRVVADMLPWPLYFATTSQYEKNAHIHLEDGGNAENSGLFSLLRRGYQTIVYVHGTQDDKAEWDAVCHLKNALEYDGTYDLRGDDLDGIMREKNVAVMAPGGIRYASYLDGLCSRHINGTDFAVFGGDQAAASGDAANPVRKLYCRRLGIGTEDRCQAAFDARFVADGEETFVDTDPSAGPESEAGSRARDAFYDWPLDRPVRFTVRQSPPTVDSGSDGLISTIFAVIPAINAADFDRQLRNASGGPLASVADRRSPWGNWCHQRQELRKSVRITGCGGPSGQWEGAADGGMSCIALAHLIDSSCTGLESGHAHPRFPQDNFAWLTLSTSYTTYAAYFDLGRRQLHRALCGTDVATCGLAADCTSSEP